MFVQTPHSASANQKRKGKLKERKLSPEGKCDKIGAWTALFQHMLRAFDFQNGCFRHQKPQGKLRERQLIRRKASVIYCDKI